MFRRAPERFRSEVILPVLVGLPGLVVARARQTLEISKADPAIAGLLGIPVNEPIAEVRRVLSDPGGTVIYLAEVTYRGDYVHLDMASVQQLVMFLLKDCCNGQPELCAPLIEDISKSCSTPGACCG